MAEPAILDVDLLAFERGDAAARGAVVDGVRRSLATGFVYTSSDLPVDLLDTAYGLLQRFFALDPASKARFNAPAAHGQTGYTGLLVETAAGSDRADWKEMLNWAAPCRRRIRCGAAIRSSIPSPCCRRRWCPGSRRCWQSFTTPSPICSAASCG